MIKQHDKIKEIDMSKFKGLYENKQNHAISTKQHGYKGLYTKTKSCNFIVKYINFGHTIFKHFLFRYLYNCRITDYIQISGMV